ncbi:redoxin domain-containing protein [Amycolatopsis sp. NPDC051903]|uniref:redoxin domain-containing protein n=1 Tax=Amycolatopsis sp. NPDC051903 TaxID=3363936 RepID=UPI00379EDCD0
MEKEVRRARNRLPELVLENTEGQAVRVADHRGEGAVLLYFSRSTACPVCARHVQDLVGRRGTPHEVVGLGRRLFGALQRSGTVLVAAAGIVRPAHAATVPTASYDRAGIAAALRALA